MSHGALQNLVQALLKYFDIRTLEDLLSQQVRNLMHHLLYCFFMT